MNRSTIAGAAGILAALGLAGGAATALGASPASAQTPPPPTVPAPCVDCDNADSGATGNPGLAFANGFACEPSTGYGVHTATATVPKKWAGPVTFYFPAATPALVVVQPGGVAKLTIRAPSGIDVFWVGRIFGSGVSRNVNRGPFRCDCDQPPTTPPVVTTPPSVVTTTPGTPSSAPSSSVPGTPTTAALTGTLPATGSPTDGIALAALGFLAAGGLALYAARKFGDES